MNLEENTRLCRAKTKLLTDAGYQHWSSRGHGYSNKTNKQTKKTRLPFITDYHSWPANQILN